MPDPVSWLLIERGWRVVGPDGEEVGRVESVTGDRDADIFDGLELDSGYVPSERVGRIVEGEISLTS
jgi:hypothetical protein